MTTRKLKIELDITGATDTHCESKVNDKIVRCASGTRCPWWLKWPKCNNEYLRHPDCIAAERESADKDEYRKGYNRGYNDGRKDMDESRRLLDFITGKITREDLSADIQRIINANFSKLAERKGKEG